MIGEFILQLHEGNAVDESIKSDEYDEYHRLLSHDLTVLDRITIENQDQFLHLHLHLHSSYLLIEGDVLKADNTRYADAGWADGGT